MTPPHAYELTLEWTGNLGTGTAGYRSYSRDSEVSAAGKAIIAGSSDPAFRGDPGRWNPEELLVASVAQCHMLWYLHLCATAGVTVIEYLDRAQGTMTMNEDGSGQISAVVLRPVVTVADASMLAAGRRLHDDVPAMCFIARSVSFPITHLPVLRVPDSSPAQFGRA